MTDDNQNECKSRSKIEQDAINHIDDGADVIELVAGLDFSPYQDQGDTYDESDDSFPFDPMVRALFLKDLMGYTGVELHTRLTENPDEAAALGFDEVSSRTTLDRTPGRRLSDEFRIQIQHTTHRILEYAHEQDNPIGLKSLEPDEKDDVSERTEDRHIKEKTLEVSEELRGLLYGAVDLDRPESGRQYSTSGLLGLESVMSTEACAAGQGSELYNNAPKGVSAPDGETLLHYLKQLDVEEVCEIIQAGVDVQLKSARRHLEFTRPAELAIDMTYVAYYSNDREALNYGEDDDQVVVMGAPPSKGYDWCMKFATAAIVGDNVQFMLAVRPHTKGQGIGELVRELIAAASEHVSVQRVYADAEFYAVDTIRALQAARTDFVIRVPANERVKRWIRRANHDVWVKKNKTIYGRTPEKSNGAVRATHVGVPKRTNPEKTVVFATNSEVDDEIALDRRETKRKINRYRRHWGLETGYRCITDFFPWTTSKEYQVRLFHFGFGMLVYNMWRLVDFLVQLDLDSEQRSKPRLKAKRFQNLVARILSMYGYPLTPGRVRPAASHN
ncbi:transposase [Haloplanus halophilus]|uniref:transposase n=1 Tax=Haloplanus halophilus TaxID=2949993 RepID=UPI00203E5A3B|nr:transposase [Haloplanus sp. GDY1]